MMRPLILGFFAFILCAGFVRAATDSFTVRTLVGVDTTPPAIPTNVTASPISISQINLAWDPSVDDFETSGYQIFRNDVQIATTSVNNYSDVGLSASTTYTYYVTAFDLFNNFSASSTAVATTTYALPPPTPTTTSSGPQYGSKIKLPELISINIIPATSSAVIRYETEGNVRSVVRWGTDTSYELGTSAEWSFVKKHQLMITDLQPNTTYRLRIEGENHLGRSGVLTETRFTTLSLADDMAPSNATNFRAREENGDVILKWDNPDDNDFDRVRVLRSDLFFPTSVTEGWVVYEGRGESAIDPEVFRSYPAAYYTIFTYDQQGNVSSGAVVYIAQGGEPLPVDPTLNEIDIRFSDIEFYQEGVRVPMRNDVIFIHGGQHLTVALPYERLPEHLKTILVTLAPKKDTEHVFRFLLRINEEKTAYTARIAPFGVEEIFGLNLAVFDFKTAQVGYATGTLYTHIQLYEDEDSGEEEGSSYLRYALYSSFFGFLLLILAFLVRRLVRGRE